MKKIDRENYGMFLNDDVILASDYHKHTDGIKMMVSHEVDISDLEFVHRISDTVKSMKTSISEKMYGVSRIVELIRFDKLDISPTDMKQIMLPSIIGFKTHLPEVALNVNRLVLEMKAYNFGVDAFYEMDDMLKNVRKDVSVDFEAIDNRVIDVLNDKIEKFVKAYVGRNNRDDVKPMSEMFKSTKSLNEFGVLVNKIELGIGTIRKIVVAVESIDQTMSGLEEEMEDGKIQLNGVAVRTIRKSLSALATFSTNISKMMLIVKYLKDLTQHINKNALEYLRVRKKKNKLVGNESEGIITQFDSAHLVTRGIRNYNMLTMDINIDDMSMRDLELVCRNGNEFMQGINLISPNISFIVNASDSILDKTIKKEQTKVEEFSPRVLKNLDIFKEMLIDYNVSVEAMYGDYSIDEVQYLDALPTKGYRSFGTSYKQKDIVAIQDKHEEILKVIKVIHSSSKLMEMVTEIDRGPDPVMANNKNSNLVNIVRRIVNIHKVFHDNVHPIDMAINTVLEKVSTKLMERES